MNIDNSEYYFPKGYLLEMDRFLRIPHARLQAYMKLMLQYKQKYGKDVFRTTAFGDFDLIGMQAIDSFPAYRQNSSQSYSWLGNQQSILLTPVKDNCFRKFSYSKNPKESAFNLGVETKAIDTPFFGVTFFCVSSRTRARLKSYNKFMEYCQRGIDAITVEYNRMTGANVVCEVFGTFHFAEIAILWAANQFVDILTLVEKIRDLSFEFRENDCQRVFNSSYSVISLLQRNLKGIQLSKLKGEALVQCTMKETGGVARKNHNEIVRYIQQIQRDSMNGAGQSEQSVGEREEVNDNDRVRLCAGEHDLIFMVSIEALCKIFASEQNQSPFYYYNAEFQKNVEKTVTRLYYTKDNTNQGITEIPWEQLARIIILEEDAEEGISEFVIDSLFSFDSSQEGINRQFDQLRAQIQDLSPPMSGITSTLDLLYSDYIQCITGANDDFWLHDFQTQFSEAIHVISEATNQYREDRWYNDKAGELFFKTLHKVFGFISTQISHITDAGRPYFDVTRPRFSRMEQVDLTLHAYYGIVKEVLRLIYANAGTNQSPLVPIITLLPMTKVASELYFDNPRESSVTAKRLINIEMPYDVWSYFHYHIPLLVHELYHFAAPLHRGLRNYTMGILTLYHIIRDVVESISQDIWQNMQKGNLQPSIKDRDQLRLAIAIAVWDYIRSEGAALSGAIPGMDVLEADACLRAEFSANLYAWIYGKQTNEESFSMAKLWEGICDSLQSRKSQILDTVDTRENVEQLLDALQVELRKLPDAAQQYSACWDEQSAIEISNDPKILWYDCKLEDSIENMQRNYDVQLTELLPDFAMVTILGMRPEEYLLQFVIFQDNSLHTPDDAVNRAYLAVRLGTVLDWQLSELLPIDGKVLYDQFLALEKPFTQLYENACGNQTVQRQNEPHASAADWFSACEKLFLKYIEHYSIERKWMRVYVAEQIMPLFRIRETQLEEITREYYEKLKMASINQPEHFAHVIRSIRSLQKQPLLDNLNASYRAPKDKPEERERFISNAVNSINSLCDRNACLLPLSVLGCKIGFSSLKTTDAQNRPLRATLRNAKELTFQLARLTAAMKEAHREALGNRELSGQSIWFRGIKDSQYHLLPSIFVHYMEKEEMDKPQNWRHQTIHQLQREKYERFKYRADGSPEINSAHRYTKIDYLALMQHYSQWTTLLDWSEDAFTSLYFALEPHFKNEKGARDRDAALYLFDPELYNKARVEIMKELAWEETQNCVEAAERASAIPNLSISYNAEDFSEFTCDESIKPGEPAWRKIDADPGTADLGALTDGKFQLPLAIFTSQLSRRIRAQSGIFIAYSPETIPLINQNPSSELREEYKKRPSRVFDYIALDRIQEYYLNNGEKFPNARPFLRKLVIEANCGATLTKLLKETGINRYRIYPELEELE